MGWFSGMCKPHCLQEHAISKINRFQVSLLYWSQKPQVGGWRIKFQLHGSYPSWHEGSYYPKHVSKFQTKKKSSSSSGLCSGFLLVQNLRLGTLVFLLGCWLQARTSGVRLVGLSIVFTILPTKTGWFDHEICFCEVPTTIFYHFTIHKEMWHRFV